MNSGEKTVFDGLLMTNEQIVWTGTPLTRPYKIRNIGLTLIDFVKLTAIIFGFFSVYYLVLQKEFFPKADVYSFELFLVIILLINVVALIKKFVQADTVLYCITDKRLLIINDQKKQKIVIIERNEIKKKKIVNSVIDREYKVQTVKLGTGDENAFLESIEKGDNVIKLL
jgi:hypothetical protein